MFRRWRVPVKGLLHSGANELTVTFASPIRRLLPATLKRAYQLPGEFDSAFGDEPKGVQTANLHPQSGLPIRVGLGPAVCDRGDMAAGAAGDMGCGTTGYAARDAELGHRGCSVARCAGESGSVGRRKSNRIDYVYDAEGEHVSLPEVTAQLVPGSNTVHVPMVIEHPERWWPVGYGPQNLYQVSAKVRIGHETLDRRTHYGPAHRAPAARERPVGQELWLRSERRADLRQGRGRDSLRQLS